MTRIISAIHHFENRTADAVNRFVCRRPVLAFLCLFIGMPLFILLSVFITSAILVLPLAWIFGWL